MLTCTTELYKRNFVFRLFGTEEAKTQVYKFIDDHLDERANRKLIAVLNAINTDPLRYSHDEKFKHLEGDVWEIKVKPLRIACIWDPKPIRLIGVYAMIKKTWKWSKQDLQNMRNQMAAYLSKRKLPIEGRRNEGPSRISR